MNSSKKFSLIAIWCISILLAGCDLQELPTNGKTDEEALGTLEALQTTTYGNYKMLKGSGSDYSYYVKQLYQLGEHGSDDVSLSGTTSDPLYYSYNYNHNPSMGNVTFFWRQSYKIIFGANKVIENITPGESKQGDQLLGENMFLRAWVHFNLVNIFGRPYTQNPGNNPGIPIMTKADVEALPARSSVKEVYDFVVSELKKSADLMTVNKKNWYASKEVAYALLSRVYLYMEENQLAVEYANKVINSGRYELVDTQTFREYFTIPIENNPETIFAIKHIPTDAHGNGNLGSMYYTSPGGVGWGEMYASKQYRDLINEYPDDARHDFIQPKYRRDEQGNIVTDENGDPVLEERNGYPKYFTLKFVNQQGIPSLSSPAIVRLAEMYLNRAEAYAKMGGHDQEAIDDVNRIRQRANLSGNELYSTSDLKGHDSVLDVVLEERRLELAWEAQRKYDVFRNGRTLFRDYPGTHLNPSNPGIDMEAGTQAIPADHPRVIFYIPDTEIELNPSLEQNP